jgi:replicative DNA helicase
MLLDQSVIEQVVPLVAATDLYVPRYRTIYAEVATMWQEGLPVDAVTLSSRLSEAGALERIGGAGAVIELVANAGFTSNVVAYAQRIVRCAGYRRLIAVTNDVRERAYQQDGEPEQLGDVLSAAALDVRTSEVAEVPSDLWTVDEFLQRPAEQRPQWVIPGLLRVGWRAMVVAAEGVGKTVLFRQLGIAAAQGVHPLRFTAMDPCRTLIVDLENPDDSIIDVCSPIQIQARSVTTDFDPDRAWLWHRPGGINLRSRRDRTELESVLAHVRPTLVCLGPIYKAYRVEARESDEQAASEVMAVFDDLRTRYGFALLLEHHAPKGSGGSRDLMPYGSSLWLRWPEIGLKLEPDDDGNEVMSLGRWRGDRLENDWPDALERGRPWPWRGVWYNGNRTAEPTRHWQDVEF